MDKRHGCGILVAAERYLQLRIIDVTRIRIVGANVIVVAALNLIAKRIIT